MNENGAELYARKRAKAAVDTLANGDKIWIVLGTRHIRIAEIALFDVMPLNTYAVHYHLVLRSGYEVSHAELSGVTTEVFR